MNTEKSVVVVRGTLVAAVVAAMPKLAPVIGREFDTATGAQVRVAVETVVYGAPVDTLKRRNGTQHDAKSMYQLVRSRFAKDAAVAPAVAAWAQSSGTVHVRPVKPEAALNHAVLVLAGMK
jgi:hypothetical protein